MNCQAVQNNLLTLSHPQQPPSALKAHLMACAVCRSWHRRLVEMERHVPQVLVPPSAGKAALLQLILDGQPAVTNGSPLAQQILAGPVPALNGVAGPENGTLPLRSVRRGWQSRERGVMKMALAAALVAALLLITIGLAWRGLTSSSGTVVPPENEVVKATQPAPLTLAEKLKPYDPNLSAALSGAETPQQKLDALTQVIRIISDKLDGFSTKAEDLDKLGDLLRDVVRDGLVVEARKVLPENRRSVLRPIIDQLAHVTSEASRLLDQMPPDAAAENLRRIARLADTGADQLRTIVNQDV